MSFVNLKSRLDDPEVRRVRTLSMFQPPNPESVERVIERCRRESRQLWGFEENGRVLGVVEYEIREEKILYIAGIAVIEERRNQGLGRAMLAALCEKHNLPIELETDDDAIGFYQKCNFTSEPFHQNGVQRWKCKLTNFGVRQLAAAFSSLKK